MNPLEAMYRGDHERADSRQTLAAIAASAGLLFLITPSILFYSSLQALMERSLGLAESWEILLILWTSGWYGLAFLGWAVCEFFCETSGPRVLWSLICVVPILAPFGLLGNGSQADAWVVAVLAEGFHRTGEWSRGPSVATPFFLRWVSFLYPPGGWTALLLANIAAGMASVAVWILLPKQIALSKRRLIAFGVLIHPLFLLSCATGLDPVWQCLVMGVSIVALLRGLDSEASGLGSYLLSGSFLGIAVALHWNCLVFFPVWVLAIGLFETSLARKTLCVLMLATAVSVFAAAATSIGSGGLTFSPWTLPQLGTDSGRVAYHLLHEVSPLPLLVLLGVAVWRLRRDWDELEDAERALSVVSAIALAAGVVFFGIIKGEVGMMTVLLLPAVAFVAILVPVTLLATVFPFLALWSVVSLPILPVHPAQPLFPQLNPAQGVLLGEAVQRFDRMRRAQQLLLASQKRNTVYVVGGEWPLIAAIHPDWVVEWGILRNPQVPVEFRDWVDLDTFRALRLEGFRFYVVGDAGRINREKFGYDLFEEGATAWAP